MEGIAGFEYKYEMMKDVFKTIREKKRKKKKTIRRFTVITYTNYSSYSSALYCGIPAP